MKIRDVISIDEMEWLLKNKDKHRLSETLVICYWDGQPHAAVPGWYVYDDHQNVPDCPVQSLAEAIRTARGSGKGGCVSSINSRRSHYRRSDCGFGRRNDDPIKSPNKEAQRWWRVTGRKNSAQVH